MRAKEVLDILISKYATPDRKGWSNYLCVPECKDGPTQTRKHHRMDLWMMRKSWSNLEFIGYEIKVSRSDFLHDNKWQSYLPMCNSLYFACPHGIIKKDEIPEECGLRTIRPNGSVYTLKKAPFRKIDVPINTLLYILMSRAKIENKKIVTDNNNTEYFEEWLKRKDYETDLGYRVSQKIAKQVRKIKIENEKLRYQNQGLSDIKDLCERLGVSINFLNTEMVEKEIKRRIVGFDDNMIREMTSLKHNLTSILNKIAKETGECNSE